LLSLFASIWLSVLCDDAALELKTAMRDKRVIPQVAEQMALRTLKGHD
jgi:hypothetical protein